MGGRGANGMDRLMRGGNAKLVAYDKWGEEINFQEIRDKDGTIIGYVHDETRYVSEPEIRTVSKQEILADIDAWRDDDGYYGDADTAVYFAYKDGSFITADDLDGKKYKKAGLVGASISTGDYQMVWGGEVDKKTGKVVPWTTNEFDDNANPIPGHSNSYSGYKTVGKYKVRVRETYNNPNGKGGYKTKREIIRRSKTVPAQ